jgi:hypothetical protein
LTRARVAKRCNSSPQLPEKNCSSGRTRTYTLRLTAHLSKSVHVCFQRLSWSKDRPFGGRSEPNAVKFAANFLRGVIFQRKVAQIARWRQRKHGRSDKAGSIEQRPSQGTPLSVMRTRSSTRGTSGALGYLLLRLLGSPCNMWLTYPHHVVPRASASVNLLPTIIECPSVACPLSIRGRKDKLAWSQLSLPCIQ